MNIEFLKSLGLTDETATALMEKIQTELEAQYNQGVTDGSGELEKLKLSQLIAKELSRYNPKNPELLKKLIDSSAIKQENGKITGLTEQIEAIKQENPFLFEDDAPSPTFTKRPNSSDNITKASFEKMSYMDRVKLYSKNPALYKKLNG